MKLRFIVDVEVKRMDKEQTKASREDLTRLVSEHLVGCGPNVLEPAGSSPYVVSYWGITPTAKGTP